MGVVRHEKSNGSSVVRLILENGEPVTLRFPTTGGRKGDARFERDFQQVEQWWLDHRGESWRPMHSEAPGIVQR
jgi:hypothetical protein